jgi:hypothetical protein
MTARVEGTRYNIPPQMLAMQLHLKHVVMDAIIDSHDDECAMATQMQKSNNVRS